VPPLGRDARPAVLLELLDDYVAEGGELLDGEGRRHPEMLYGALLVVVGNPRLVLGTVLAQEHRGGPPHSLVRKPVPEFQDHAVLVALICPLQHSPEETQQFVDTVASTSKEFQRFDMSTFLSQEFLDRANDFDQQAIIDQAKK
jgi:hypothetical protein